MPATITTTLVHETKRFRLPVMIGQQDSQCRENAAAGAGIWHALTSSNTHQKSLCDADINSRAHPVQRWDAAAACGARARTKQNLYKHGSTGPLAAPAAIRRAGDAANPECTTHLAHPSAPQAHLKQKTDPDTTTMRNCATYLLLPSVPSVARAMPGLHQTQRRSCSNNQPPASPVNLQICLLCCTITALPAARMNTTHPRPRGWASQSGCAPATPCKDCHSCLKLPVRP
ncbi:hypothetical protein COO60DRAFT_963008 [Scenedesmus sp. NREL 46B-D3]|nr:hypothetical protein COO60DRAFT_963008 [Scenedesmus sp. NREL 46B-D3]